MTQYNLDANVVFTLTITGGGDTTVETVITLRDALLVAAQHDSNGKAVTITDPQGREFFDLQLWADVIKNQDRYVRSEIKTITNW